MKITIKKRTTRQVLAIERVLTPESRTALQTLPKPNKVCGVRTPLNLNDLTIGDLFSLQADGVHALIEQIASVILKVHPRRCYNERADKMLGFVFWVGRELERIAALFASTSNQPTPEEAVRHHRLVRPPTGLPRPRRRRKGGMGARLRVYANRQRADRL